MSEKRIELVRGLGPWAAMAIVVGTIIGTGIFLKPGEMAAVGGSVSVVYAAWIVGGVLTLFGALSFAELGAAMPEAGGQYAYLTRGLGPVWGILAAGFRHCGAEFREGKRPKQRKHPSNDPCGIDNADRAAHGGHFARLQKNPRPDNRAHNNSHRGPWTESSNQLNPLFAHRASLASLGCTLSASSCPNPAMRLTTAPAMYVVPEPINTYQV